MTRDISESSGVGWEVSAKGDFDIADDGAFREIEKIGEAHSGLEGHIVDRSGELVMKVAVLFCVRAEPGGITVEIDLPDDPVLHKGFQTVINGREGNVGNGILDPQRHVIRGGMIAICH